MENEYRVCIVWLYYGLKCEYFGFKMLIIDCFCYISSRLLYFKSIWDFFEGFVRVCLF